MPRKRKSRGTRDVAEILRQWREYNEQIEAESCIDGGGPKSIRKPPPKGSRKGCMKGKGGPENGICDYRGVRQRRWGKWVAEIREPDGGARLWLGTFSSSYEAALAYDEASKAIYGQSARLNLPLLPLCQARLLHFLMNLKFVHVRIQMQDLVLVRSD